MSDSGWNSAEEAAIRDLPQVTVSAAVKVERRGYSDNYVALMPGERRTIRTEPENADTRGERPRIVVQGFNTGETQSN